MRHPRPFVRTAVLSSLLLAGGVSTWFFTRSASSRDDVETVASASRLPLFRWTRGEERTYQFVWDDLQRVTLPTPVQGEASTLDGTLHLGGTLSLQALDVRPDGARLRLALESLTRHEATLAGQTVLPDANAVAQHLPPSASAWVELDARGALMAIRFSPSEPALFQQLAQTLAAELFPTELRDAAEWSAVESTQTGDVEATFRFEGPADAQLTRRRSRYQRLRASADETPFQQSLRSLTRFERAPDGGMAGVLHDESLDATRTDGSPLLSRRMRLRVEFASRQVKPLPPPEVEKGIVRRPSEIAFDGDPEMALLRSQAEGMTVDEVLRQLASVNEPEALGDLPRFMRRAVAAFKLEPGRTRELAVAFQRQGAAPGLRELMMDVLTWTGHAQAQATMRELLQTPRAREHMPSFGLMVQRAGLLQEPEPETARMLLEMNAQARAASDVGSERASAYALGGIVSHLPPNAPEVATYMRPLETALRDAASDEVRAHALVALGNTGREEMLDQAAPHLRSESTEVRAAAAEALRRAPQEVATRMLLDALDFERSREVQNALLDALDARVLDAADLERLRGWVVSGRLVAGAESNLLNVISRRLESGGASFVQMLQVLALRPGQQPATRARVMSLMAQVSAMSEG
ncbi:HEAT repeat domain-containing protein [Myxococcus sp. K15C18031901]|uniref:HEAT repeat domain-containing protein n=1 Tax=Myxococcus dinghuensis TaxID=2906761 RepID=UPI0020A70115|nr:HEAT repeat domain-containing protein [Myxococcus dinghuensis]MCP3099983.1 HEAT repeat domain-containing protein [Myxococcus dinghuensis]